MKVFRKGALSGADIVQWLTTLRKNAHIPESGFAVSAVFQTGAGYYFGGVNVENIDHRLATHAEEGCIAAMVAGLGRQAKITEGWLMGALKNARDVDTLASCCGKCRQQIAGFAEEDVKIHSVSLSGKTTTTTVGAFLPDLFTFRQFLPAAAPAEKSALPSVETVKNRLLRQAPQTEKEIFAWLKKIESVDDASKISQSVVLQMDNGACVAGAKIEEAAFNSISAAQGALAVAVAEFGACAVREAWVYTKGRDGKELPPDRFGTLPMSALQTLLQCAEHAEIPIRFFAEDGSVTRTTLSGAAKLAPTSGKPFHEKP